MKQSDLLILNYAETAPTFASPVVHAGPGSAVLGRATSGRSAWLGAQSVIRADGHYVTIGDDFRLGPGSTVHIAHGLYPTEIGSGVTAGSNTVIHACVVHDRCWFGNDVVILDGSVLGAGCALADGAIVFPGTELEGGWYYEGMPAKPVRKLSDTELDALHARTRAESDADAPASKGAGAAVEGAIFVAATARVAGDVRCAGGNGIWFGCDLDAGRHTILVGRNTNIQDNTIIRCRRSGFSIGEEATVGHNVTLTDCSIGNRSLVGIGAVVAPGTRIGDDVLLAAGARTSEGQVLEENSFYAGNPAKRRGTLDDRKRKIIALTWPTYCEYADLFDAEQRRVLADGAVGNGGGRRDLKP